MTRCISNKWWSTDRNRGDTGPLLLFLNMDIRANIIVILVHHAFV